MKVTQSYSKKLPKYKKSRLNAERKCSRALQSELDFFTAESDDAGSQHSNAAEQRFVFYFQC